MLLPTYAGLLKRSPDCRMMFETAFKFLWEKEKYLHPVLDVSTFIKVTKWRIDERKNASERMLAGGA